MDPIMERRSVRTFTPEPVTQEELRQLLAAAMAAPSAVNQQPWEFYVVQDAAMRESLSRTSPYAGPAAKAPVCIVPCLRAQDLRAPEYALVDLSAATENLLVKACELGLGGVWLGVAPNQERSRAVAQVLGCPDTLAPFALVPVGHPADKRQPTGPSRFDESRIRWVQ